MFSKSGKNSGSFYSVMDSIEQQHMDVQGNTFAFGVLLLEIISGRPSHCKDRGSLVNWVSVFYRHLLIVQVFHIRPYHVCCIAGY